MADRKLNSLTFPTLPDRYILDAGRVKYNDADAFAGGTVGKALQEKTEGIKNLITASAVQTLENKVPYLFRQTPNAGHNELDTIVGGTVAFNQLVPNSGSASVTVPSGHKYFSNIGGTKTIAISNGSAISATGGTDNIFDLTQMFGSTVADYIYSLEQANAGAGVAYFKSLGFDKPYYEYNEGELMSVSGLQSHDTVGFNQFDGTSEGGSIDTSTGQDVTYADWRRCDYMRVLPNTDYGLSHTSQYLYAYYYDGNKNFISALNISQVGTFTTPVNCAYMRLSWDTYYGANVLICINISDPAKNGTYEPYIKHSYSLDSTLTLRGIPKLDASNNVYYDGDVYEADGSVTRKYKIVTYNGSENWGAESGGAYSGQNFYIEKPSDALPYSAGLDYAQKFLTAVAVSSDVLTDNTLVPSSGYFNFAIGARLGITTVADFKTYLASHPISVLYPIATPTAETAESYQYAQACDPNGTEEYVTTGIVPVGHDTKYPITLSDIMPTASGNYVLKCTVTGGVASYEWVSES